jgi:hypothetical protein
MTDSPDYRLYLESKFNSVHEKLDVIKEQTLITNNRVNHLEEQKEEYLRTRVSKEDLEVIDAKLECVDKELLEYRFFKKYPKVIIILLAFLLLGLVGSAYASLQSFSKLKTEVDMINTPVKTRSGTIEFWPSGVVIDSLNKSK